jgi:hypothetical protein
MFIPGRTGCERSEPKRRTGTKIRTGVIRSYFLVKLGCIPFYATAVAINRTAAHPLGLFSQREAPALTLLTSLC